MTSTCSYLESSSAFQQEPYFGDDQEDLELSNLLEDIFPEARQTDDAPCTAVACEVVTSSAAVPTTQFVPASPPHGEAPSIPSPSETLSVARVSPTPSLSIQKLDDAADPSSSSSSSFHPMAVPVSPTSSISRKRSACVSVASSEDDETEVESVGQYKQKVQRR